MEDFLLFCFIKNNLNRPLLIMFFFLLLYLKWPLWAFIGLYQKLPFSPYHFIENGLIRPLWKTAFIKYFLQYCLIKNGLYRGFFALSLHQKWPLSSIFALLLYRKWHILTFIGLYRPLLAFITNGLFHFIALSKTAFICLYRKCPCLLYHFITLSKTAFICLY